MKKITKKTQKNIKRIYDIYVRSLAKSFILKVRNE